MGGREKQKEIENTQKDSEKWKRLQNTTMPMEFQFLEWHISRMSQWNVPATLFGKSKSIFFSQAQWPTVATLLNKKHNQKVTKVAINFIA